MEPPPFPTFSIWPSLVRFDEIRFSKAEALGLKDDYPLKEFRPGEVSLGPRGLLDFDLIVDFDAPGVPGVPYAPFIRPPTRTPHLWAILQGGGVVGGVGFCEEPGRKPFRGEAPPKRFILGIYVKPACRGQKIGTLACAIALGRLWGRHPGAPVVLYADGACCVLSDAFVRLGVRAGFTATAAAGPLPPLGCRWPRREYISRFGAACASLRACRRALAWALVRATRQASPHPFAAFLRRNPGLLHVVGRRVLAYWCYPADIYHRHLLSHLYPLRG